MTADPNNERYRHIVARRLRWSRLLFSRAWAPPPAKNWRAVRCGDIDPRRTWRASQAGGTRQASPHVSSRNVSPEVRRSALLSVGNRMGACIDLFLLVWLLFALAWGAMVVIGMLVSFI